MNSRPRWAVLKFGGTSVASRDCWETIAQQARARQAAGQPVLLVVSAVRGITDALQRLTHGEGGTRAVADIVARYRELAGELGFELNLDDDERVIRLRDLAGGGELSSAQQAWVLGCGEYLTCLCGEAWLRAQGLDARWHDAADLLTSVPGAVPGRADNLSANCAPKPDAGVADRLFSEAQVILTQGFVARHPDGHDVVLGRGGSDTSAAYLAVLLDAERLEIWTDVPGLFSTDPRLIPGARLLQFISYREAQELASMGARVLHPRSIEPLRQQGIALHVRWTERPEVTGTEISAHARDFGAQVKGIVSNSGVTLIAMEGFGMWHQVGFLADAFALFKRHGFSVDLVSTSEANVTVSLDMAAHLLDGSALDALVSELEQICSVRVIHGAASVSLVGMGIRTILHKLGQAFEIFEHRHIYLVSQAANDLNLTFVVDAEHAEKLVMQLHQQLIPGGVGGDRVFGQTWEQLHRGEVAERAEMPWWERRRDCLLELMRDRDSAYVYCRDELLDAARRVAGLGNVQRSLYAMKANPHQDIVRLMAGEGLGLECVSLAEVRHALAAVPDLDPKRILFTPNFAPREEYRQALKLGVNVTIDNLFVLEKWGSDFSGREVFVRLDPGSGLGHHKLVRTAGANSKFGIIQADHAALLALTERHGVKVVGLHAHVGSGVMHPDAWHRTLGTLADWMTLFPDARTIDVGGGLGVPDRRGELPLDLKALDRGFGELASRASRPLEIWIEPGRYLVSPAGVLLARVTQLKGKGEVQYVGVATGMNSLIRPALYGAYHEIVNLSRLHETPTQVSNVVGPICETGDILGLDRLLPPCEEGDILLIANAGAYAAAMASHYNMRPPAPELMLT